MNVSSEKSLQTQGFNQKAELQKARAECEKMLSSNPGVAEAYFRLAILEGKCNELQASLVSYDKAIGHNKAYAEAYSNRGIVLRQLGKLNEALSSYDKALSIRPDFPQALLNRGSVLKELKHFDLALESYNKAIALKPDFFEAHSNLGVLHQDLKQCEQAIASFDRAIALNPAAAELHWNKSLCLLVSGDYEQGFSLYEWRWKRMTFTSPKRNFTRPLWLGVESLKGKTILLYGEQGFGDSIQFCRYAKLVADLGATVIVEAPAALVAVMSGVEGVARVICKDDPLPEFDFQCPLMSLPLAFKTNLNNIPSQTPYLKVDRNKVKQWRAHLGAKKRPRVGIVWSGSPGHENDVNRSMSLAQLARGLPPNIQYVSLQKEVRKADKATLSRNPQILDFSSRLKDFSDTAALAQCMDLVISVDTSVAHLSAALNIPTWVLVPYIHDWRWLLDRDDSPWYKSVKIFRQQTIGHWDGIFKEVKKELGEKFGNEVLKPPKVPMPVDVQTNEISSLIQLAFSHHNKGEIPQAQALYEKILQIQSEHFDALQLLGAIVAQTPDKEKALELISHALEIDQSNPVVFNNHGNVLNELKRYDEAIQAYQRAISIRPDYTLAHFNLAGVYKTLKQFDQALALYNQVIKLDPDYIDAYVNRGSVLKELNQLEKALEDYDRSISLKPGQPLFHSNKGAALHGLNRLTEALASYDEAIALKPDFAEVLLNRGVVLNDLRQHELARDSYERAIAINPNISEAHSNLGVLLQELGHHLPALASYDRAIELKPDSVEAHWNKALTLLLLGDFENGWPLYEYRWSRAVPSSPIRGFKQPLWLGQESLQGKTILLYGEQGFGDTLQFCRYAKLVAQLGGRVVLEVPRSLVSLLEKLEGVSEIVANGSQLPAFDFQCPMMSLPYAFKTNQNTIPSPGSYLKSDHLKVTRWKALLGEQTKPRIGIVWSGSTAHKNDFNRSLSLDALLPYLPREFQYVSLQKEIRDSDRAVLKSNPQILDFSSSIQDFTDTAALVQCMDLVISVDTSVAHLSAALGKQTWIFLSFIKDWRWMLDRSDSPWYDAVKLYRQDKIGDWTSVFAQLQSDLASLFRTVDFAIDTRKPEKLLDEKIQRAFGHHQKNELMLARALYEEIIQAEPKHFDALQLLATIEAQTGNKKNALALFDRALALNQSNPIVYFNHGNVLDDLKDYRAAIASFDRAITLKSDYAQAYASKADSLRAVGDLQEALASYERAIAFNPRDASLHFKRAMLLKRLNKNELAIASFERSIALNPGNSEVFFNLGILQCEMQNYEASLNSHQRSIELNPRYAEQFYNHGLALQSLQRMEEALASYDQAIKLKPQLLQALLNRGHVLKNLKRYVAAVESYEQVLTLKPDYDYLQGIQVHTKMFHCDWGGLQQQIDALNAKILNKDKTIAPLPYLALNDSLALQSLNAKTFAQAEYPANSVLGSIAHHSFGERIRIGYYSADFHNHATAYLMAQLFELHDKTRFELIAFSFGPPNTDEMRGRLIASFEQFLEVNSLSDAEIASLSREKGIDIAIDLKGYTGQARPGIFACRAAPVQVSYLGYPGTMGADYIDYLIADSTLIPAQSQQYYAEKIVYMPHSYQVNDAKREISQAPLTRAQFGLPEQGFVFCCFNNNYKITPEMFDVWMRILDRVPGSVLWLLEDNPEAVVNLRKEAIKRGINDQRLIFAPRQSLPEHLARHRLADLFLDTLPCNAHTTASDALWAGLPLLTCLGESFASRVSASLLNALGLPELIVRDLNAYEKLAVNFALDPVELSILKVKLSQKLNTSPLFDTQLFTSCLESAYRQMIERYQAGLMPDHLHVQ